jgi:CHAT domain
MRTLKLQLSLSKQGHIEARVTKSPYGEALEVGPYDEVEAARFVELNKHKRTFLKVLESQSSRPSIFPKNAQDWLVNAGLLSQDRKQFVSNLHKKAGQLLFDALFLANANAKQCLHDSRVRVSQNETLHIQFIISGNDQLSASLLEYPWELLHDKDDFLAWQNITFSRYIAYGDSPPEWSLTDKLEVLLVSLDAYDEKLGLTKISPTEIDEIKVSLQRAVDIHIYPMISPSFREFGRYLSKSKRLPHIIHFHGHGLFGKKCKACRGFSTDMKSNQCKSCQAVDAFDDPQGYILFKGEGTPSDLVSAERLAIELRAANMDESRNQSSRIELVVLSTCQSGLALNNYTIFNGIAQRLIKFGIPAVVAMQFSVDILAAADFAERFYTLLGRHAAIAEAMKYGRVGMRSSGKDSQWFRPVLYTRWGGGEKGHFFIAEPTPTAVTPVADESPPVALVGQPPPVQVNPPVKGSFYESIYQLHAQVEMKRSLLTKASAIFTRQAIWWDICSRELEHLQEVSGPVQELSSCIDRADIGKLTEEENQLRNIIKKPAHDSKGTLDELISQVIGLISLLKNRAGNDPENFEMRKSEYLFTIQGKFTALKKILDQIHNIMESC